MAQHTIALAYNEAKVIYTNVTGLPGDWSVRAKFTLTINPADIDGDGQHVDDVRESYCYVTGIDDTHSHLGVLYSDFRAPVENMMISTLLSVFESDYSYDWPGEGESGSSPATDDLVAGLYDGSISFTYPGILP